MGVDGVMNVVDGQLGSLRHRQFADELGSLGANNVSPQDLPEATVPDVFKMKRLLTA